MIDEVDQGNIREVLRYCYVNISYMWAAKIAGILLDCDFRESKEAIEKHMGWSE